VRRRKGKYIVFITLAAALAVGARTLLTIGNVVGPTSGTLAVWPRHGWESAGQSFPTWPTAMFEMWTAGEKLKIGRWKTRAPMVLGKRREISKKNLGMDDDEGGQIEFDRRPALVPHRG
jgi:hypothetical protein